MGTRFPPSLPPSLLTVGVRSRRATTDDTQVVSDGGRHVLHEPLTSHKHPSFPPSLLRSLTVGVLSRHGATIDDAQVVSDRGRHVLPEPLAEGGVHFLGLVGRGGEAGADRPDGLVG